MGRAVKKEEVPSLIEFVEVDTGPGPMWAQVFIKE